jgi:hypothetical protein
MKTWKFDIELTVAEKQKLLNLMVEELNFYNALNLKLVGHIKNNPVSFQELKKKFRLIGETIEHGFSKAAEMEVVNDDLLFLSDGAKSLLNAMSLACGISNRTKRNMGVQIFKHYLEQSYNYKDGQMVKPVQLLETLDLNKKRHIQLHRKTLIVESEGDKTFITLPYLTNKVTINYNAKRLKWNILIIHQKTNTNVNSSSEWCIDLLSSDDDYCLNYLDNLHYKSPFDVAKNDYRKSNLRN